MSILLNLQTAETVSSNCFTFREAAEIVAPLLGPTDFLDFMENSRYIEGGVPNKYYIRQDMFKIVLFKQLLPKELSHSIVIYITKTGMALIVQKALRYYQSMHSLRN
jgi:hypothetical protein